MIARGSAMTANINPDLQHLARDIETLKPDPNNARKHSRRNLDAIAASLREYGQNKPIVASRGVIVAGNGTLEAARSLGWDQIAVIEFRGAGVQRMGYALADNRTAELADWDFNKLNAQLNLFENQLELQYLWSKEEMEAMSSPSQAGELGRTPEQNLETFQSNTIKQIVLYLEEKEYIEVLQKFRKIMGEHGIETSTDVVLMLLNHYEKN